MDPSPSSLDAVASPGRGICDAAQPAPGTLGSRPCAGPFEDRGDGPVRGSQPVAAAQRPTCRRGAPGPSQRSRSVAAPPHPAARRARSPGPSCGPSRVARSGGGPVLDRPRTPIPRRYCSAPGSLGERRRRRCRQGVAARQLCRQRGAATGSGKRRAGSLAGMLAAIRNLVLSRLFGARVMLALALLGFVRRLLGGRRREPAPTSQGRSRAGTRGSAYQSSQGSSQIVQREPR